jgi:hypothetical protein
MASKQDQLPFDDGLQRSKCAQRESRNHQTGVTGRRAGGDDLLECPTLNSGLNSGLDPAKRPKTGVDSE